MDVGNSYMILLFKEHIAELKRRGEAMKELLAEVKGAFSVAGYRKKRNSFWKREGGFYRLVDFQHGAYGDYFFINVGLHPVGLPSLIAGELVIKEQPKEYECIFHQRVGEISPIPLFQKALVPISDPGSVRRSWTAFQI